MEEIYDAKPELNRIVLSYNPVLTICLACIHLTTIGDQIAAFKHEVAGHIEAIQTLGNEIIAGMKKDKPYIEELFMDKDFKDRTVLHLISYNNFF